MPNELKPCPFCGGEAEVRTTDLGTYKVVCIECPTDMGRYWSWAKKEAIAAWNRRANDEQR